MRLHLGVGLCTCSSSAPLCLSVVLHSPTKLHQPARGPARWLRRLHCYIHLSWHGVASVVAGSSQGGEHRALRTPEPDAGTLADRFCSACVHGGAASALGPDRLGNVDVVCAVCYPVHAVQTCKTATRSVAAQTITSRVESDKIHKRHSLDAY